MAYALVVEPPLATVVSKSVIGPRKENQDRSFSSLTEDDHWVLAVADGLGGHARGAEAAQAAIGAVEDATDAGVAPGDHDWLRSLFGDAGSRVEALARDGAQSVRDIPMSTLAAATLFPDGSGATVAWLGDTMGFVLHIEEGHVVGRQIGFGHNDPRGGISRCLGFSDPTPEIVDVQRGHNNWGVALLSDGIWEPLLSGHKDDSGRSKFKVPLESEWEASQIAELLLLHAEQIGLSDNASVSVACEIAPRQL